MHTVSPANTKSTPAISNSKADRLLEEECLKSNVPAETLRGAADLLSKPYGRLSGEELFLATFHDREHANGFGPGLSYLSEKFQAFVADKMASAEVTGFFSRLAIARETKQQLKDSIIEFLKDAVNAGFVTPQLHVATGGCLPDTYSYRLNGLGREIRELLMTA